MSQSEPTQDQQAGQVPMQIGGETIYIEVEPEIAQMFERIQDTVGGNRTMEQALANFMQQYGPKIEEQFQTAIFNEYQQVRLQQKVNQNGNIDLQSSEADNDVSPEDTTSPNRL